METPERASREGRLLPTIFEEVLATFSLALSLAKLWQLLHVTTQRMNFDKKLMALKLVVFLLEMLTIYTGCSFYIQGDFFN